MKIIRYECPICYTLYDENPKACTNCGYSEIKRYIYEHENKEENIKFHNDELFNVFKYTKAVYSGKIPFEKDVLDILDYPDSDRIYILGASGHRGVAVVDYHNDEKHVVADDGILAFSHAKALILNTDEIKRLVLDESLVRILFLGPDVKFLTSGYLSKAYLKYIFVDSKNKFFCSDNNVLFNKNKTELILYASLKNEEEYVVPNTVKKIGKGAFRAIKNLRKLYIPKITKFSSDNISSNSSIESIEIIRY